MLECKGRGVAARWSVRVLAPPGEPPDQVRTILGTPQAGKGHGGSRYHGLRVGQKLVQSRLIPGELELGERFRVLETSVFSSRTPDDVIQGWPDRSTVFFRR